MDEDLKVVLQTFIVESSELLENMESSLLSLESDPENEEIINSLFRSAHTIKGSAGIVGLEHIEKFTHSAENLLSKVRDGQLRINSEMIEVLLESRDLINMMISNANDGIYEIDSSLMPRRDDLVGRINNFMGAETVKKETVNLEHETIDNDKDNQGVWHISIRFDKDIFRNGMDPLSYITYMQTIGEICYIETILDNMPRYTEMDPESCYLGFEIFFKTEFDKKTIEGVFDFVEEDCSLKIIPPRSKTEEYVALIRELPEDTLRLGDILVKAGVITDFELEKALNIQKAGELINSDAPPKIGEILSSDGVVHKEVIDAALDKQKKNVEHKNKESKTIRVDAEKLDALINLVGELVTSTAGINQHAARIGDSRLQESTSIMTRLVEDIRERAMQVRMVPIGETFTRFQRVVRDIGKENGKDIELIIIGGDTELDKTVTEKIGDPLMHLVRNSADHGIEIPEERVKSGKSPKGTIQLKAYNDAGSIVVEITDDGKGLDKDKIYAKAVEKGVITEGAILTEREIFRLIFEPGFSTAEKVTKLSGRGVGMDVVRKNIESLRGSVELESEIGTGTTVRIRLPLTLAIIDGFMVGVGESNYIIPLEMVTECIEFPSEEKVQKRRNYVSLRGEVLPFIILRDFFGEDGAAPKYQSIVVVKFAGQKTGFVVDQLYGEVQTVIKNLGAIYKGIQFLTGATILGDGTVALILDIPKLVADVEHEESYSD